MNAFKHPLLLVLVPFCIFVVVASYFRFMVAGDYIVEYEGTCDPVNEACFAGCMDDECTELHYHTMVRKYASDVLEQCGVDFSDCEEANTCLPSDRECAVTYCDASTVTETESCDQIEGALPPEGAEEILVPTEEEEGEEPDTLISPMPV